MNIAAAIIILGPCVCFLAGCSYCYTASDGTRHIVGLVDVATSPPVAGYAVAGDYADVTTVGVAVANTTSQKSLTVGYSRDVSGTLLDNKMVVKFSSPSKNGDKN